MPKLKVVNFNPQCEFEFELGFQDFQFLTWKFGNLNDTWKFANLEI